MQVIFRSIHFILFITNLWGSRILLSAWRHDNLLRETYMDNRKKTENIEKKNRKLVGYRKVNNENRRNSACNNLGRIQNNVTGLDREDYYSPCIHRICTAVEETLGSNKVFLKKFQKIACKVSLERKEITFDESSALLFFRKCPEIFKSCGLKGLLLNMLTTFLESMSEGGNRLVEIRYDLTWQIDLQVWETG